MSAACGWTRRSLSGCDPDGRAQDLNPNPDNPARLSTAIDLDDTTASIDLALSVSGYFRLSLAAAREIVGEVDAATSGWRTVAAELDIPKDQADRMAVAYESDQRRTARSLSAP
jgi:serine/threonine-protein kinase HipA